MSNEIKKVTVIGAGAMGSQIAMVSALGGYEVVLYDIDEKKLKEADETLRGLLGRKVQKGKMDQAVMDEAFSRLQYSHDFSMSLQDCDLVIEAIVENLEIKQELFAKLDQAAPSHTILATNSSTIVSSKLAKVTNRPEKVCNVHFFNPALVMELVEVVKNPQTSEDTAQAAMEFAKAIGKAPILLEKEIYGFVANRILNAVFDEAMYLYENGVASIEEIDLACTKGLNYPIGPFKLIDLTGIDINYHIRQIKFQETNDEKDLPQKCLTEKYEAGELGKKTGKGFYQYS